MEALAEFGDCAPPSLSGCTHDRCDLRVGHHALTVHVRFSGPGLCFYVKSVLVRLRSGVVFLREIAHGTLSPQGKRRAQPAASAHAQALASALESRHRKRRSDPSISIKRLQGTFVTEALLL